MKPTTKPLRLWQKIIACIFVGVFTVAAVHLTYSLTRTLAQVEKSQDWQAVSGQLDTQNLEVRKRDGDSAFDLSQPMQSLTATYSYSVDGQTYKNSRIDFSVFSADNFSSKRKAHQQDLLRQTPLTIYVDPADPASSVIDRSLPAETVLFCVFFILFPCGFAVLIIVALALYPFGKRVQSFALPLCGIFHGGLALWVLINHHTAYGFGGLTLLGAISLLFALGVYHALKPSKTLPNDPASGS